MSGSRTTREVSCEAGDGLILFVSEYTHFALKNLSSRHFRLKFVLSVNLVLLPLKVEQKARYSKQDESRYIFSTRTHLFVSFMLRDIFGQESYLVNTRETVFNEFDGISSFNIINVLLYWSVL